MRTHPHPHTPIGCEDVRMFSNPLVIKIKNMKTDHQTHLSKTLFKSLTPPICRILIKLFCLPDDIKEQTMNDVIALLDKSTKGKHHAKNKQ